jgi:translation initiation factor 6 (eIF-6)
MIIYGHKWLNLAAKNQEGWMIESKTRSRNVIRATDNILVKMSVKQIKKFQDNLFCNANFVFSDDQGGIFEVDLKGFLS